MNYKPPATQALEEELLVEMYKEAVMYKLDEDIINYYLMRLLVDT